MRDDDPAWRWAREGGVKAVLTTLELLDMPRWCITMYANRKYREQYNKRDHVVALAVARALNKHALPQRWLTWEYLRSYSAEMSNN